MFSQLILASAPVFIVLLLSEYLWRKKIIKGERARKFIHILAGVWIAFWPFYIPFDGIFILGVCVFTMILYSRFTKLFHAIYDVKRTTYGDVFYALAIIICAYLGQQDWIFTTSILLLALADGGAAVVGKYWGVKNQYFVFGSRALKKSVYGTLSYIVFAYLCIVIGWLIGGSDSLNTHSVTAFFVLPIGTTFLENISPYGLDNLLTPLFTTILLNGLI